MGNGIYFKVYGVTSLQKKGDKIMMSMIMILRIRVIIVKEFGRCYQIETSS